MMYERCPNCKGRLGIPDKKRGQQVKCPHCDLEFTPPVRSESSTQTSPPNGSTAKSKKPSLRALPVPSAIAKSSSSIADEPSKVDAQSTSDPMMPPVKQRLDTRSPPPDREQTEPQPVPAEAEPLSQTTVDTDAPIAEATTVAPAQESGEPLESPASSSPAVAKIIKSEFVQPLLSKEGNLPTLQLKDAAKPKKKDSDSKTNPATLALILCASLVSSGLMLLFVSTQPASSKKAITQAREKVREFYEVRVDEELAPFQRELREAQLAHSRGDYKAEIRYYQRVMARFRSEDRSQYKGLTGSPTWDIELEELVSILLNDAKRKSKSRR